MSTTPDSTIETTSAEAEPSAPGDERIARGGVRSLLFRIAAAASDALIIVVTARGFGADGRGLYALVTFAAALLVTVFGGVVAPLSAELAHKRESAARLHAASIVIALVGGGVTAAAMCAFVGATWPDYKALLFPALVAPFLLVVEYQLGIYQAEGDVKRMHWLHLSRSIVPLVALTVVAIVWPDDIYLALGVWAAVRALHSLVVLANERRRTSFRFDHLRPVLRRLVRSGAPVSLGNGIARLNYRVDMLVVAALLPLADVGRYSVAVALGEVLWLLSRSVMTGAYASVVGADTDAESVRVLKRAFRHSVFLLGTASVAVLLPSYLLMEPIFGEGFQDAWPALVLLLPGIIALGGVEVVKEFFLVRLERSREYLIMAVGAMLINLAVALALVPWLGLPGAAISTSLSYLGAAVYLMLRFRALVGLGRWRELVPGREELTDYTRLTRSLLRRGR